MSSFTTFAPLTAFFQTHCVQLACTAINHLLNTEPSIQVLLNPHAQRTILLHWEAGLPIPLMPAGEQALQINTQTNNTCLGLSPYTLQNAVADVTVTVQAAIMFAPASEKLRYIRIEGDVLLAQTLSTIIGQLRWDATQDLARVIGDVPAYWVAHHAKKIAMTLQTAVTQFSQKTSNTLTHHSGWILGSNDFKIYCTEMIDLKMRIDTLNQQINHLITKSKV